VDDLKSHGCFYLKETEKYQKLPVLKFNTMRGDTLNTSDIINNHYSCVFVFFHPDCSHCREEINDIMTTCITNNKIKWIFITTASPIDTEPFFSTISPLLPNNVYIISEDDYPQAHILFDVSSPPAVFIFNTNGRLCWHRKGEIQKGLIASIVNR